MKKFIEWLKNRDVINELDAKTYRDAANKLSDRADARVAKGVSYDDKIITKDKETASKLMNFAHNQIVLPRNYGKINAYIPNTSEYGDPIGGVQKYELILHDIEAEMSNTWFGGPTPEFITVHVLTQEKASRSDKINIDLKSKKVDFNGKNIEFDHQSARTLALAINETLGMKIVNPSIFTIV